MQFPFRWTRGLGVAMVSTFLIVGAAFGADSMLRTGATVPATPLDTSAAPSGAIVAESTPDASDGSDVEAFEHPASAEPSEEAPESAEPTETVKPARTAKPDQTQKPHKTARPDRADDEDGDHDDGDEADDHDDHGGAEDGDDDHGGGDDHGDDD